MDTWRPEKKHLADQFDEKMAKIAQAVQKIYVRRKGNSVETCKEGPRTGTNGHLGYQGRNI